MSRYFKSIKHTSPFFSLFVLAALSSSMLSAGELSGNISLEGRYFTSDGAFSGQQEGGGLSLSIQPEYKHKWDDDRKQFTFSPFYRWDDNDKERTHADIRQLDYIASKGDWELQAGISKVYWGVAESQHLVDIVNQTDLVEGLDGEDKLGQPMFRVSRISDNGSLDFFVLPYFRERTFGGVNGRFRSGLAVDTDKATYESSDEEKHIDYALRWSETIDEFDVGVHYFDGTSRDPILRPLIDSSAPSLPPTALQPHYPQITQLGLDLQYTGEEIIWKFEAINRGFDDSSFKDYTALVGGFEYSLPAITESGAELSLLAEYHHDSRGEVREAAFQNDLFVGARLAMNDEDSTDLLAGAFVDLDNDSTSFRVEASRRIGKGLKLNIEGQVFSNIDDSDPLKVVEKDDYIQLELQKFF